MVFIRQATAKDMLEIQNMNLMCLPENYNLKYYSLHFVSYPELSYVATVMEREYGCEKETVVGYVLGKLDEDNDKIGHITSLAVRYEYRKLGLAKRLMEMSMKSMRDLYRFDKVTLHVRVSNASAIHLYKDLLSFRVANLEQKYYLDGEDSYNMEKLLVRDEAVEKMENANKEKSARIYGKMLELIK